ncbi:hypothetical protein [Grimontia sp. NTOU-MAR1]|uniref:hypothetical protein n=1 Tax=Grimontia sp. NTOU-MAR1 TaxID=3111011 RepID=UPI002DBCF648|nr:hypothetical protein [Grimontia sp. NTOU-MAR1]WRW00570.1 hypothetical protein VP504_19125 [Grimontia sp. NTOU-MAR1]
MTGTYDWNPMPHKVEIKCPACGGHCIFEFADVVKISLKKDVPFFKQSDIFEYSIFKDGCGHKWHGAIYFANLHGGSINAITDLPDGYSPENWSHSKYLTRNHGLDLGAFSCSHCQTRKPYILQWPQDAYYSFSYKGEVLWAFNRESAVDLRDYIASNERKTEKFKWASFLLHIPTIFKKQNARDNIVKQINKAVA